ncbi:DNA/RNA non-specific endonuclease [Flagellimonas allohymeniacidonis]|uniref:Endonuclease n=1 Tax=Flagellimonas allohymeniacidonis TaxID=2517819 RepID=A0A4V2HSJ9_9FLAO|nr:DNA/RNA non-specific endonuclease [Allomuricauda hymeniacidonis]TAI48050.1 DNA/RNA non-specific endonuclease [Allomuricauda hymeniacidonis]
MKRKTIYTVLIIICIIGFWLFENFYTPANYSKQGNKNITAPLDAVWLPSSTYGDIVSHEFFMLSYNEPYEQAEWVAYPLKKSHLTYDDRERPYFIEDPKVKSKSADWRNYRGSGYDRGHLCPAGDRRFSEYAYNETFYTSNISPQDREFNAGIWNRLEQRTRYWCKKYGDLIVITGGVLRPGLEEIGEEDVDVPDAFYKIIIKKRKGSPEILSFLIPNWESNQPLQNFLISIDKLEEKTGLNFFEKQSEDWQQEVESTVDTSGWSF